MADVCSAFPRSKYSAAKTPPELFAALSDAIGGTDRPLLLAANKIFVGLTPAGEVNLTAFDQ